MEALIPEEAVAHEGEADRRLKAQPPRLFVLHICFLCSNEEGPAVEAITYETLLCLQILILPLLEASCSRPRLSTGLGMCQKSTL